MRDRARWLWVFEHCYFTRGKNGSGERGTGRRVTQVELQQNVQRVATAFIDRIAQSGVSLSPDAPRPAHEEAMVKRVLVYSASALDIATGPFPELNTLDMLVFAMLCKDALERHGSASLGKTGEPLLVAFADLEKDMWDIAPKVLDQPKKNSCASS